MCTRGLVAWRHSLGARLIEQARMDVVSRTMRILNGHEVHMWKKPRASITLVQPP